MMRTRLWAEAEAAGVVRFHKYGRHRYNPKIIVQHMQYACYRAGSAFAKTKGLR